MKRTNKFRRKVCVFTATRAEFGLLHGLLDALHAVPSVQLQVLVSGTHLSSAFGLTVREIEASGLPISARVPIVSRGDGPVAVCRSMGRAMDGYGRALARLDPDLLVVLGDRYEALCVTAVAQVVGVPVAHIHGGEATEGTMDEAFRHAITKMSCLHFPACAAYAERIIRMGEDPSRVFAVGSLGVENIRRLPMPSDRELAAVLGFAPCEPYLLATMHPATFEEDNGVADAKAMLAALDTFPGMRVVLTAANADPGGREINRCLRSCAERQPGRCRLHVSLGNRLYLAAMARCLAVVGNSSSGIIEAPSLHVPTVNIGDRQRGRLRAGSVIDCPPDVAGIAGAIRRALGREFRRNLARIANPYEGRSPSRAIRRVLACYPLAKLGPKTFYE